MKERAGSSPARSPPVRGSPVVNGSRFRRLWSGVEGSSVRLICVVLCVVVVVRVVVDVVVVVLVAVVVWWRLWLFSRVTVPVAVVVEKGRGFSGHLGPASGWPGPLMSHWNIFRLYLRVGVCVFVLVVLVSNWSIFAFNTKKYRFCKQRKVFSKHCDPLHLHKNLSINRKKIYFPYLSLKK